MTPHNADLRLKIVDLVCSGGGGHIPSSFSIIDILDCVYKNYIGFYDPNLDLQAKYSFTLSKGHAACALYSVLHKYGYLGDSDLGSYLQYTSILGGHPDCTKVHGAEASTGSLGHGLPFTIGRALASKIAGLDKVFFVLVGDGECHEGTIWESAIVANNLNLSNIVVLVDYNKSSDQICPHHSLYDQFSAFGWHGIRSDGHNPDQIFASLQEAVEIDIPKPRVIIFDTIKGYGVPMLEGHGPWHYKIPNSVELELIQEALS